MTKIFPSDILAQKISGEFMTKKYFYFQPQYVDKFKCDGSKCNAHCCSGWNIFIDEKTFAQYPQEIAEHMEFNSDKKEYRIVLDDKRRCPFLNKKCLCRIQLKYGEKFLSQTCATYPRVTCYFGGYWERSLTLSCPLAAKLILFEREPMKFEFIEVPEKIHSPGGKIFTQSIQASDELKAHLTEIQVAMISILQERTLTIEQRLIVLGFFIDRLGEIFADDFDETALTKLIAAYESKKFLAEQVPLMLRSISFDEKKFVRLMLELLKKVFADEDSKFLTDAAETLKHMSDKKIFLSKYSGFLENYLINELFLNIVPFRFIGSLAQNFITFAAEYKLFELIIFGLSLKGSSKKDLIEMVGWFTTRFDHNGEYKQKIFEHFDGKDDIFELMGSLLANTKL